ncbi:hypothetical protein DYBT9275_03903 [Dyadobacter sp. CECT 9275]|uniref:Uncharacterized protein n=1 Tax=Dyadobacter helix TaxID=2822344 RepID=A0A916JH33_9BACT|nr:hypothetical protein [Dyadobacter sp. CECT 9275]CAG5006819.1 hypothetical protein DYBT9275_03903 [Dyadobacter sp. CECT 9275]
MDSNLEKLRRLIEQRLGWGSSDDWQGRDFDKLSELIFEQTKVSLSDSTLKRLWGKINYQSLPSSTTLDTLARFAGFDSWRVFVTQSIAVPHQNATIAESRGQLWLVVAGAAILSVISVVIFLSTQQAATDNAEYSFSSKHLDRTIPNSVIFTYDATAARDSVFIQLAGDEKRKTAVDKNAHTFSITHYEPGFYNPQLVVGQKVVKTHDVLIATKGWLAWIANGPIPVYLDSTSYIFPDKLEFPVRSLVEKVPDSESTPCYIRYYNVGNFGSIPVTDFSFSTQVKSNYKSGAAACQYIIIQLITDGTPIKIPLSAKGCVSELALTSFGQIVSGRHADLSNFGIDPSSWVNVSCRSYANKIQYFVDGNLAYEGHLPDRKTNIVGVGFSFLGTGAARQIELKAGDRMVFKAF